jgi:hypothetical protein
VEAIQKTKLKHVDHSATFIRLYQSTTVRAKHDLENKKKVMYRKTKNLII